ncbi:hypothetical protein [Devosia sp.]|uniref:hypothetical protein n=1 Tax=Devosia sp. TaxID=1871048 RepID=UPI002EEBBCD7
MAAVNEMARLQREIEALAQAIDLDLRPNSRTAMTGAQRQSLRADIERCLQRLDELRSRLSQ